MKIYPPYKIFLSFILVFFCVGIFFLLKTGDVSTFDDFITGKTSGEQNQVIAKKSRAPEISGRITQSADQAKTLQDSSNFHSIFTYPEFVMVKDIEFPGGNEEVFFPLMESLIGDGNGNTQTRILFYGDSQLEGDRITSYFRRTLQKRYGGSGPGMVPLAEPKYPSISLEYESSKNWVKHDFLVNRDPSPNIGVGTMLSYCRFEGLSAFVKISITSESSEDRLLFDRVKLFLADRERIGTIRLSSADSLVMDWQVPEGQGIMELGCEFQKPSSELALDFEDLEGVSLYGVSLESSSGVQVDNIAHRGSAGLEFSRDTTNSYRQMSEMLDPDLVILHFGINVVPAKRDDFSFYGKLLKKEILLLQERIPGIPILVVGVSDMGHLVKGIPTSYDAVEKVNEVQRTVARQTGTAYFDLLAFMGGSGSFEKWMEADPVLMRKDYTHFSHSGGELVAEGLARALIKEVDKIKSQKENGI